MNLFCKLGFHDWGEWSYISDKKCERVCFCKRDKTHQKQDVKHIWKVISKSPDPNCKLCNGTGNKKYESPEPYNPGLPSPLLPDSAYEDHPDTVECYCSAQKKICGRCSEKTESSA